MKKHVHYHLLALLWVALLTFNNGLASPVLTPGEIPLIRINTEQHSSLEIGLETGRQSKALFPDIERRYDTHLSATLNQDLFDQIQRETLPKLLKALDPEYQEELKGVAGAWSLTRTNKLGDGQLSLDEYQIMNLLPDIGFSPDGTGFGVFSKASTENGPIIGRNLDWVSTPALRSLQAITVYQDNNKAVVNVGFAGIISVLTGFNNQGLFLAHYKTDPYSPYRKTQRPSNDSRSSVFDSRKALETSTSIQQAARYLSRKPYAYSHSLLMADKKSIQVLEYPQGGAAKLRQLNSPTRSEKPWDKELQIAVIDCHVLATMPNNCKDIKDAYRWQRLRQLAQFSASKPASVQDIANILFDTANPLYEIFNPQTLQSMIYLPANGSLYLYTAATHGPLPVAPVHNAYLDIVPVKLHHSRDNNSNYVTWTIGLLLLVLSTIVFWITLQNKKKAA